MVPSRIHLSRSDSTSAIELQLERIYLLHSSNRQALELFRYTIRAIYPPTPERVAAARGQEALGQSGC